MEKEVIRYFDKRSGLWYLVYWDDVLKCYVTVLESGQHSLMASSE
ncbi:MAG: hypothetical protein Kow0099_37360 [Candidatus Abyssubacteria bacterium]